MPISTQEGILLIQPLISKLSLLFWIWIEELIMRTAKMRLLNSSLGNGWRKEGTGIVLLLLARYIIFIFLLLIAYMLAYTIHSILPIIKEVRTSNPKLITSEIISRQCE